MTIPYTADVLICGAGAAGLTLAIDLARRGISFRLIDKMNEPFHGSRGKGIQPRTQEIFEDLGVLDHIAASGGFYPKQRQYRNDGSYIETEIMDRLEPTPSEPFQQALMIPQFLTEGILRRRLAEFGEVPDYGCELIGFEQHQDAVVAHLNGGSGAKTLSFRWLVGADGGRSFVRHALDVGFPGKTLAVRAIVADVHLKGLQRDAWHRFGEADLSQQISLCPLAGTDLFQIQGPIPMEADPDLSIAGLNKLIANRTLRHDIKVQHVAWSSAYTMNARLADRYRVDKVFLIGDAAHIHPPTGGQGLNTSVQDAYNLGWKMAAVANGASDSLLDTYEEERRPIAEEMLGLASRLLDAQRHGDSRRGREVQQLDLGYLKSSLSMETPVCDGAPCAGYRAPDAVLRGASGQSRRLFDLFQGPHWTLIGFGISRHEVPPRKGVHIHTIGPHSDIQDEHAHFRDAYRVTEGTWILIRPDGYIGAMIKEDTPEALEIYMASVGLPRPANSL